MISILIALALALTSNAQAQQTHNQMSLVVAGHGVTLRAQKAEIEASKARITTLEAKAPADCRTSNAACDATVAALRKEHDALARKVGELDDSIASVEFYLLGAGGTKASPRPGSLEHWRGRADDRLYDLEAKQERQRKILEEDFNSDGIDDGGLVGQVASLNRRTTLLETTVGGDTNGDGVADTGLAGAMAASRSEFRLGVGAALDIRQGFSDPDGVYSFGAAGASLDLSVHYQWPRGPGGTPGIYASAQLGSGTGVFAGPTYGWKLGEVDVNLLAGFRFLEIASQEQGHFALRSTGAGAGFLGSIPLGDSPFSAFGRGLVTATYDSGAFAPAVGVAGNIAAGLQASF